MKLRSLVTVMTAGTLMLAGCGTTTPGASAPGPTGADGGTGTAGTAAATPGSGECANVTPSTGPVTVTDSFGRKVTLDKPAQRVAIMEWQQIEDALTLCLTPVAVADAKGYALWDTAEPLPAGVTDVGTRQEPNIEAVLAANPDLVIVEADSVDDEKVTKFEKRGVKVLATKGADAADPVAHMLGLFTLIGQATGREERATQVVTEFRASQEKAKTALAGANLPTKKFVYYDGWIQGGNVAIRPFGQGSLIGELGESLGLVNAWTGPVDEAYGLGQTDIEGMSKLGDAQFFATGTVDPEGDVNGTLAKNRVWAAIPAVKEGRAHTFPAGIWTFGGPRSSEQILDAYVSLLTK